MNNIELANTARAFAQETTCYLRGTWGQYLSESEYARLLNMYPANAKYNNQKYVGNDKAYPFDCICFVKGLLGGVKPGTRISYNQMAHNPIGDCTTEKFLSLLYDEIEPKYAPVGYGLATKGHAAISLGGGYWIDANYSNTQNGIQIHSNGIEIFAKAGKIPGIEYEESEREVLRGFCDYLIDSYLKQK